MRRVCVFCGSARGKDPIYVASAREFGQALAKADIELVYGGGKVGIMGAVADAVMEAGGRVTGIIPQFLYDREVGHTGLTELIVVNSMHERKAKMAELSDAFVALPGGVGTFEEFIEVMTWALLGLHNKPCALLNTQNYYDLLLQFLDHSSDEGFLSLRHRQMIVVEAEVQPLLARLSAYRQNPSSKFEESDSGFI